MAVAQYFADAFLTACMRLLEVLRFVLQVGQTRLGWEETNHGAPSFLGYVRSLLTRTEKKVEGV